MLAEIKSLMFKQLFLATILFSTNSFLIAQINAQDYRVYASIVKTEIQGSTKSIAVIKNGIDSIDKNENTNTIVDLLTSKNVSDRYQVYRSTENNKKERSLTLDSNFTQLLIDYCKSKVDKITLADSFNSTYKTLLLKKSPIRRKHIQQDWKSFYEKHPGSGGIFSFSQIKYYKDDKIAIVYFWVRRNGLNGHGAIAILTKINNEWQMEYKTYLWWN